MFPHPKFARELTFLAFFFIASIMLLSTTYAISFSVEVLDSNFEKPIGNAYIAIRGPVNASTYTNDRGEAIFEIPNGTYKILVFHEFYKEAYESIHLIDNETLRFLIERKIVTLSLRLISMPAGTTVSNGCIIVRGPLDRTGGWEETTIEIIADNRGNAKVNLPAGIYAISAEAPDYRSLGELTCSLFEDTAISIFLFSSKISESPISPIIIAALGWILGSINYFCGWILVTLPLTHRGLKNWGWTMIEDGATYAFLVCIYSNIFLLVSFIWQLLYGYGATVWSAYERLLNFFHENFAIAVMILVPTRFLAILARAATIKAPEIFYVAPILQGISDLFLWIGKIHSLLFLFAAFIFFSWPTWLSLGALLYGLPARVGRYAGAGMMAFSLIYYIGLPFLPSFVSLFSTHGQIGLQTVLSDIARLYVPFGEVEIVAAAVTNLLIFLASYFLNTLVLPLAYIAILGALSAGLAHTLGGRTIFRAPVL